MCDPVARVTGQDNLDVTARAVKNIIDKIWDAHVVEAKSGYPDLVAIDLHLIHEVTTPQAFTALRERGLELFAKERTIATVDHNVSTTPNRMELPNPVSRGQILALRQNVSDFGIKMLDMGSGRQGIVHVVGPELGLTQPGLTIVCGDSHTSTHGAFGALAFGIGTSQVGHVLATSCLLMDRPKTCSVTFEGKKGAGVTAKDLILKLIHKIGVGGGVGYVLEYCGDAIRNLSMEERMTICNMSIECGARAGLVAPDEITFQYMRGREGAPSHDRWPDAVKHWKSFASDPGAAFDREVSLNIDGLAPMVTWGTNPGQSTTIEGTVPKADQEVLDYVGLKPGQPLKGIPIDYVFVGSCTNARLSDLEQAARIVEGKKVANGVAALVVPGSETVRQRAIERGLDRIFTEAGFDFREPGCSSCLGMNEDKIPAGKRCASSSNRNFVGRQGPGAITHLMSPIMAACAAITGEISDVRDFL